MDITQYTKELATQYAEENNCTAWDINNGLCADFAADLISKLGGYNDSIFELSGDMFFNFRDVEFAKENWGLITETEYGVWSDKMLDLYGCPPINIHNLKDELAHVWVFCDGKHYDAETPEGVTNWFQLPFFQRYWNILN